MSEEGFEGVRTDDDLSRVMDDIYEAHARSKRTTTTSEPNGAVSLGDGFADHPDQPELIGKLLAANDDCQELISEDAQARVQELMTGDD